MQWKEQIVTLVSELRFDTETLRDLEVTYEAETGRARNGAEILLFYMFAYLSEEEFLFFKSRAIKAIEEDNKGEKDGE